ncbi:MAG: hypothetical protein KKA79_01325 [Nanoarchaeota archaeon]|nr:hypothetical protein [Nanoarchaeota archaeon]MCG2718429.1 hypothetical protein [Nanoarchaeota archaeon]
MKLPKSFKPQKDLDGKIKDLVEGHSERKIIEDPSKVKTFHDAINYLSDSQIPTYGYDDQKRIRSIDMPLKQIIINRISLGKVDLMDENPFKYKGLNFTQASNSGIELGAKLNFASYMAVSNPEFSIGGDILSKLTEQLNTIEKHNWRLTNIAYLTDYINSGNTVTVKIDTPKEILWVFETFKKYKPIIHGGALRDLYLGIDRTADIDIQIEESGMFGKSILYNLVKKAMDKVKTAKKGEIIHSYGGTEEEPCRYKGKKDGVDYDIAGRIFERYLSTEQMMMKKPGELIMWELAKNDLDNKQFRLINITDFPKRMIKKIEKLQNIGLEFLPEHPNDLATKLDEYDILRVVKEQKSSPGSWY